MDGEDALILLFLKLQKNNQWIVMFILLVKSSIMHDYPKYSFYSYCNIEGIIIKINHINIVTIQSWISRNNKKT